LLSPHFLSAAALEWQGEWGKWSVQEDGASYGGSISIFNCSNELSTCRLLFETESKETSCRYYREEGLELRVSSSDLATADLEGVSEKKDCRLELKMVSVEGSRTLQANYIGKDCGYFCTSGPYFPKLFPFNGEIIFPWFSRVQCYTDTRKSTQKWCRDSELQKMDTTLKELGDSIESLTHDRDFHKNVAIARERFFTECETTKDIEGCFRSAYEKEISKFQTLQSAAQQEHDKTEKALSELGDATQGNEIISQIEGVYKERFPNALVDGTKYTSENIMEIVPVSSNTFYFKLSLEFYNGHSCEGHGLAHFSKAGTFVYNSPGLFEDDTPCTLQFAINATEIRILDPDNSCDRARCGARGMFHDTVFPRKARRKISYMEIIKNSEEYKEAIATLEKDGSPK
jgi:hypothetical protein